MSSRSFLLASCALLLSASARAAPQGTVVLVTGAPGNDEYAELFAGWAESWTRAVSAGGLELEQIGRSPLDVDGPTDRDQLERLLQRVVGGDDPLWLVLQGHGTFDGAESKFNLRGPDVTATELSAWLAPIARPTAVILCASATGPFVNELSAEGRIVVTATRSGHEYSFSRFGGYLARALVDPAADLDKDGQVSLLEAFLFASGAVADFYASEARLASEHALIDDNGDGQGTPADWFRGVRVAREVEGGGLPDGARAHRWHLVPSERERAMPAELRAARDDLELKIEELRLRKPELSEDDYYDQLERLMLELARVYERLDS